MSLPDTLLKSKIPPSVFSKQNKNLLCGNFQIFLYTQLRPKDVCHGNYKMELIEVDLKAVDQICQVGAHFKALGKGVLVAPLDFRCIFITSQTRPQERCVPEYWKPKSSKILSKKKSLMYLYNRHFFNLK